MNNIAEESFSNIRTVKAFSNEKEEMAKYYKINNVSFKIGVKQSFFNAFYQLISKALLYGSIAVVVYVGSHLYRSGDITIGQLSTFLFYMLLVVF